MSDLVPGALGTHRPAQASNISVKILFTASFVLFLVNFVASTLTADCIQQEIQPYLRNRRLLRWMEHRPTDVGFTRPNTTK